MTRQAWSRVLLIAGLAGMLGGAIDPLEGCVVILAGSALIALAAFLGNGRYRALIYGSFVLIALGVTALLVHSAMGGFGGDSGRSNWWWLSILPYPTGWILGLTGAFLSLRRPRPRGA
jgi:hypothetical protein